MPLIVIRIFPETVVDPSDFTSYLNPAGLGPLQISVYDLSFDNPQAGTPIATASYIAPSTAASPTQGILGPTVYQVAQFAPNPSSGIVQQTDWAPPAGLESGYFQLESVANAIIAIPSVSAIENLVAVAQYGSGAGAVNIPIQPDYYNVVTSTSATPSLNAWDPILSPSQPDPWGQLAGQTTSLYLPLPAPPSTANPFSFQLPTDGTPPPFDTLLGAVQQILSEDPGALAPPSTSAPSPAGGTTLTLTSVAGVVAGMSATGAGIPAGTTVSSVSGNTVTLTQELSALVASGAPISFAPDLATLSYAQCENIAYEIVWSQQPPLPSPPSDEPFEDLFTDPPNTGQLLLSGNNPNPYESDRQQFQAKLTSYYSVADTTASRLTNFVYALSAAIACEQMSLAATQATIEFPVNPGAPSSAPLSEASVILTGIGAANPAALSFGAPAAYFYALGSMLPTQIPPQQRYQIATGDNIARLLTDLTSAINTGTVTDDESFVTPGLTSINAAQAARRIIALGVPPGSATAPAPLGTAELLTTAAADATSTLTFASTAGIVNGMLVSGPNIGPQTTVTGITPTQVTLSAPVLDQIPSGNTIVFTPVYSAHLVSMIQAWLSFPQTSSGQPSSQAYLPIDDATDLWPQQANAFPDAFLNLVLSALTQGFMLPPPFNISLGEAITTFLTTLPPNPPSPTVANLAAVTTAQWTAFFQQNPTWLPPFTQPGNTTAQIAAFIRSEQQFFEVASGGPPSEIDLATTAPTASGLKTLTFAPTTSVVVGMSVSGLNMPVGATVTAVATSAISTTVTISVGVSGAVPMGTTIFFTPSLSGTGSSSPIPLLQAPSTDWLGACLTAYGAFVFGNGFNLPQLQAAAATVFPGDPAAQAWVVDALVTIDALYQVMKTVALPPPGTPSFEFSVVEALYARGFKSAADITRLTAAEFTQAVTGTIARSLATAIYTSASAIVPPTAVGSPGGGFQPINPDGSLTNCIPPLCFSPLGPIAYLNEMLQVSPSSTCANPLTSTITATTVAAAAAGSTSLTLSSTAGLVTGMSASGAGIPANTTVTVVTGSSVTLSQAITAAIPTGTAVIFGGVTLGSVIAQRRGPIGTLAATRENCEIPIPVIDMVNECLESMVATASASGVVYNTTGPSEDGDPCCEKEKQACGEPAELPACLPEYSTPATPVAANSTVEPAVWEILKTDLSSCCLPYSQPVDVSRMCLRFLRSCRFEEMRTFRKCITEFVLAPANQPSGFNSHLWRYPVRIDIAIEYLGITAEEYALIFQGTAATPCAPPPANVPGTNVPQRNLPGTALLPASGPQLTLSAAQVWQLYGFASTDENNSWANTVIQLPEFLERTCLTYCEFYELWKSGYVVFGNGADEKNGGFPQCEPCCLDKLWLQFPREGAAPQQSLLELAVFIRLWRKLKESCCFCYSFDQLRDICDVLRLFIGGAINPDFIRQFAALQMLLDQFHMEPTDRDAKPPAMAIDADRTQILALWVGPSAAKWNWAVNQLIACVEKYARHRHKCDRRSPEFLKLLTSNLDPLSRLAGFDPASTTANWHAAPTCSLRFAEVLAKIYASDFSVGEIYYLFTAQAPLDGDDPFPLQEQDDALDSPLALPDEEPAFSLGELRRKLLDVRSKEEDGHDWSWKQVESALQDDLGFAHQDVLMLGQRFFPRTLREAGYTVDAASTRFVSNLAAANTSPGMWNIPPDGPFQYDSTAQQLWTAVPLTDDAAIWKLTHVHNLNAFEQTAIQDLYFQPRAMLAEFSMIFGDFAEAQKHLIEERDEAARWDYFRTQIALTHRRCAILAQHLTDHVAKVTGQKCPEGDAPAFLVLRDLSADENLATAPWENTAGTLPAVTWNPAPIGSAFAALLGLAGTGLVAEYKQNGTVVWRDICGALEGFGKERNKENAPVPTVLPAMSATLQPAQMKYVSVLNGFLSKDSTGAWLGGAQGFDVTWYGAMIVDRDGVHEFHAGAAPEDWDEDKRRWRAVLKRGQRTWVLMSHRWLGEADLRSSSLPLRNGAYELTVELSQSDPEFPSDEQIRPLHTGLEIQYSGPDANGERIAIPHDRLFAIQKNQPLGTGITVLGGGASSYLSRRYVSSLRDIRRTYQRAFKALLFVHRFGLSARRTHSGNSELGYMLEESANFAGFGFYLSAGSYASQAADFNFNFLPLRDDYYPPAAAQDDRVQPSPQRIQAMFDWWERIFDYTRMREEVHRRCDRQVWRLFEEAQEKQPAHPGFLLRHIGADSRRWTLDLRYFQGQGVPVYEITATDLEDDRWTIRAWHADAWLRALECCFTVKDIAVARPDLWASDDPAQMLPSETQTGNANLLSFLLDGCLENGELRRYADVRRLNDGLRERGRKALLSYLCRNNRVALPWGGQYATVPRDLSDLLLLDVEVGICEKATRIEEAISAVQDFIRRARLHLEPGWIVTREFARMWDREFSTFRVWQACKRRHLYKENWIEWDELGKARKVEAFRFLESKLQAGGLTVAAPGGLEWWPGERPPAHRPLDLIEKQQPSEIEILPALREGLNLLGTPARDARPSWLTTVPSSSGAGTAAGSSGAQLPFWMEAAIKMGTHFYRVAAAGTPIAGTAFKPHKHDEGCVNCCQECGCEHPGFVDEYYFWLIDDCCYTPPATPTPTGYPAPPPGDYQDGYQTNFYDPAQQESALWEDPTQLPQLLLWQPSPAVRLAWCRIHNGEFQQPRRSAFGVAITPGAASDLTFLGRTADSLYFSVSNAIAPVGYADPSAPGFRYDIAPDCAVVLPQVTAPPAPPTFLTLPAYPYFVYDDPGASLFPLALFTPSLAVAEAMRANCHFEAALQWYRLVFDPLSQDCTWVECGSDTTPSNPPAPVGTLQSTNEEIVVTNQGACCDSTQISCEQARDRSVVLHYLETLIEWADAKMRRYNSPEAFEQARVILDAAKRILGKTPANVPVHMPPGSATVATFQPEIPPLNPRLLDIYEKVGDRLDLIHAFMSRRRLRNGRVDCEMPYFGDDPVRQGWRSNCDPCAEENEWCCLVSPYRFSFLIQKAQALATKTQELGASLLSAFEKGDAEYLASLRQQHERELLALGLQTKQDAWRDADWQIEALQEAKAVDQANLVYYNGLINAGPGGLIDGEIQYQSQTSSAISVRGDANIVEGIGEGLRFIPDIVLGAAGFGGSPVSISWIPLGTKIGEALEAAARIMNNVAEISSISAGLDQTNASWLRRLNEWVHQTQTLAIQIEQAELQILGAQRRRDAALQDVNMHRRQTEQSAEVQDFLRDKFTAHDLYLFMQKETAALYHRSYELAFRAARQAQAAFNLERGHTTRHFLPDCAWDNLHEGLLAGERLVVALHHMEKAYCDENIREYELSKNFSLRLHFPMEYLRLRTTGYCEIEIPEWMYDLDYPGQYMRRIRNVSLTLPCVTGPYTGVHCRLTLINSMTRIDPRLSAPVHECCCKPEPCCRECGEDEKFAREYEPCPDDPRIVREYGAREAIVTSTGQSDAGMFEPRFTDERYLPFEFRGAVARFRIELPPENNYFELSTLSDAILRVNYTSREGGSLLRRAAHEAAHRRLPGDGWCFFDVRHEFPDAWQLFRDSSKHGKADRRLRLRLDRKMFPFVPGGREIWIEKITILFGCADHEPCCPEIEGCPCPVPGDRACRVIEFRLGHSDHPDRCERNVACIAGDKWPDHYCGMFDTEIGPLGRDGRREIEFRFPPDVCEVERVFLLMRYTLRRCPERLAEPCLSVTRR